MTTWTPEERETIARTFKAAPEGWPLRTFDEALAALAEWERREGRDAPPPTHLYRLTHSHHHEWDDLRRVGVGTVYVDSIFTKYVSTAWHLAGRFEYDDSLVAELAARGWPSLRLIEFGAAPWIQAIFYARKGLRVAAINQSVESDAHRFGRWLAEREGVRGIDEYASDDPAWRREQADIVYCVDVFEHIPPLADGSPGWVPFAEDLLGTLRPGGVWYANAPLTIEPGTPHPVPTHINHYTSPFSLQDWERDHGLISEGSFLRRKAL